MVPPPAPSPPDLRPDDERLLDDLLALPPEARAARLRLERDACPARLERLAPLLAELDAGDRFLEPDVSTRAALLGALCADWPGTSDRPLLDTGALLGPYSVVGRVGRGGMGEVYRARDRELGRDVALKVFAHVAGADDERLARLRREARLVAALNHPNVAAIYGTVTGEDVSALVLEFVDGPTLADRLRDGPLDCAEAIVVARQLVEALEAARARRIVHRDLKPANIAFARDGRVKVLDFGIATVWRGDAGASASVSGSLLHATHEAPGLVAGTAAYMSPEQVRGDTVGHRTDVWAFGCVLFEMLTGVRAFEGSTTAEVLTRVLEQPPPFDRLPQATPAALRHLVTRCLEKDSSLRPARISEASVALDDAAHALAVSPLPARRGPRWWAWASAAAVLVAVAAVTTALWPGPFGASEAPTLRLTLPLPAADELVTGEHPAIAITPDGRSVVYRARRDGVLRLFRRAPGAGDPAAIDGTVNAAGPFLSPDGEWVGFHLDGVLMKTALRGGSPTRIAEVGGGGAAASWSRRDDIVFAPVPGRGLYRVPAAGGTPIPVTAVDPVRGESFHGFPEVLPDGHAALFTVGHDGGTSIAAVNLATGATVRLAAGRQARYLPGGILLVVRDDTLWAAPFDARRLALRGELRPVTRGLDTTGTAQFAVSSTGTLVFVPRDLAPPRRPGTAHSGSPDGRRFLSIAGAPEGESAPARRSLLVVQHWTTELAAALAVSAR